MIKTILTIKRKKFKKNKKFLLITTFNFKIWKSNGNYRIRRKNRLTDHRHLKAGLGLKKLNK